MGELIEIDPTDLAVSSMNERQDALGPDHDVGSLKRLEQSVSRVGVLEPPIVRKRNIDEIDDYDSLDELRKTHNVIIGQRRMLAAQNVGLDTIPVIVVEWDDADALEASIVENIDVFRDDVGKKDRAIAVYHLKQMNGWTQSELADHLNVSNRTIRSWLEYFNNDWKGTIIHGKSQDNQTGAGPGFDLGNEDVNKIPIEVITTIRQKTGGKESGVEACAVVIQEELSKRDVRKARDVADDPSTQFLEALKQVAEQKHSDDSEQDASEEPADDSDDDSSDDDTDHEDESESTTEDSDGTTRTRENTSDDKQDDGETVDNDSEGHNESSSDSDNDRDEQDDDRIVISKMTFDEQTSQMVLDEAEERNCSPKQFVIEAVLEKIDDTE